MKRTRGRLLMGTALTLGLVLAAWTQTRLIRFEVSGRSMLPLLRPGDWLLASRHAFPRRPARPGDLVLVRDPREPARVLVKRVAVVDLHGSLTVLGDNPRESTDSRAFGPLGRDALLGRVALRYWPAPRLF